jgi:hypothetical protein
MIACLRRESNLFGNLALEKVVPSVQEVFFIL